MSRFEYTFRFLWILLAYGVNDGDRICSRLEEYRGWWIKVPVLNLWYFVKKCEPGWVLSKVVKVQS